MKVTKKVGPRGGKKVVVNDAEGLRKFIAETPSSSWGHLNRDAITAVVTYFAERLDQIATGSVKKHKTTRPSEWNRFFGVGMKAGKTPAQISAEWKARKVPS